MQKSSVGESEDHPGGTKAAGKRTGLNSTKVEQMRLQISKMEQADIKTEQVNMKATKGELMKL